MSQMLTADETLQFLHEYRDVTHQLHELASAATVDEIELDRLTDLLALRDRLIESFGQSTPNLSGAGAESLLADIRQMDGTLSMRLRLLLGATQQKMHGVQEQKRGANAYQSDYTANSVFFDRKK